MSDPPRVALVAGASGGIGSATARRLAADGYALALTHRSTPIDALLAELTVPTLALHAHLDRYEDVARAVRDTVAHFGRLDAAIYCAGPYLPQRWITELDPQQVPDVLRDDATACWNLVHASLLSLRETQGCIVAVSTPAVRRHARKDLLSSVPKAAVEAIIRAAAAEEGRFGIRANAVAVGVLDDGMHHELRRRGDFTDRFIEVSKQVIPLGRLGNSADIAEAIAFLTSPKTAGYISGQTVTVDGGYSV